MIAQDGNTAEKAVLLDTANVAPVEIAALPDGSNSPSKGIAPADAGKIIPESEKFKPVFDTIAERTRRI